MAGYPLTRLVSPPEVSATTVGSTVFPGVSEWPGGNYVRVGGVDLPDGVYTSSDPQWGVASNPTGSALMHNGRGQTPQVGGPGIRGEWGPMYAFLAPAWPAASEWTYFTIRAQYISGHFWEGDNGDGTFDLDLPWSVTVRTVDWDGGSGGSPQEVQGGTRGTPLGDGRWEFTIGVRPANTDIRGVYLFPAMPQSSATDSQWRIEFVGTDDTPTASGAWPLRQRQSLIGGGSYPLRQRQNGGHTGSWALRQRQASI